MKKRNWLFDLITTKSVAPWILPQIWREVRLGTKRVESQFRGGQVQSFIRFFPGTLLRHEALMRLLLSLAKIQSGESKGRLQPKGRAKASVISCRIFSGSDSRPPTQSRIPQNGDDQPQMMKMMPRSCGLLEL